MEFRTKKFRRGKEVDVEYNVACRTSACDNFTSIEIDVRNFLSAQGAFPAGFKFKDDCLDAVVDSGFRSDREFQKIFLKDFISQLRAAGHLEQVHLIKEEWEL